MNVLLLPITNRLQDNRGSEGVLCVVILLFVYIMYDYCHVIFL